MKSINYNLHLLKFVSFISVILPMLMILQDFNILKDQSNLFYWIPRISIILFNLFLFINIIKNNISEFKISLLVSSICLYSIHGQLFSPGYFLAFIQIIFASGLFFPIPRKTFLSLTSFFTILMIISIHHGSVYPSDNPKVFFMDISVGIVIMSIASVFGHKHLTLNRLIKDKLYSKFLDVGINSSSLIHDLKGLLSTPASYIHILKNKYPELLDDELFNRLSTDINFISKYVKETNSLSLGDTKNSEIFTLEEMKESLEFIMYTKNIKFELDDSKGTMIKSNKNMIKNILFNLTINSYEAMEDQEEKIIKIRYNESLNQIIFTDNGPGFSQFFLKEWGKKSFISTKTNGSGIGLFTVQDSISKLGGNIKLYNSKQGGAEVSFTLC